MFLHTLLENFSVWSFPLSVNLHIVTFCTYPVEQPRGATEWDRSGRCGVEEHSLPVWSIFRFHVGLFPGVLFGVSTLLISLCPINLILVFHVMRLMVYERKRTTTRKITVRLGPPSQNMKVINVFGAVKNE